MKTRFVEVPLLVLLATTVIGAPAWADWKNLLDKATESVKPAAGSGSSEVAGGLKQALGQGARYAVETLGQSDGFFGNQSVRIGLPDSVEPVAKALRATGQGESVDAFEESMNRAAEEAVPASLDVLQSAIEQMTIDDAKGILNGGDTAATDYLRRTGGDGIAERMRPLVARATDSVGVTRRYKQMMDGSGAIGNLMGTSMNLDAYVTENAVDGLFHMIALEERRIRSDPAARGTELLKKVFGSN